MPEARAAASAAAAPGNGEVGAGGCAKTRRPASGCSEAAQRAALRWTSGSGWLPAAVATSCQRSTDSSYGSTLALPTRVPVPNDESLRPLNPEASPGNFLIPKICVGVNVLGVLRWLSARCCFLQTR